MYFAKWSYQFVSGSFFHSNLLKFISYGVLGIFSINPKCNLYALSESNTEDVNSKDKSFRNLKIRFRN